MEMSANQILLFRGIPVHYLRRGTGRALVLLHNGGTSHTIWRHFIEAFSATHDVIALDLPGFGASNEPATGLSLAEHVELVGELIGQLRLPSVTLIGNCMGSAISLLYAAKQPERVEALVLFNPLSESTFRASQLGRVQWLERFAPRSLDVLSSLLSRVPAPKPVMAANLTFQLGDAGREAGLSSDHALQACYARPGQLPALRRMLAEMHDYAAVDNLVPSPHFPRICTIWGMQNHVLSPAMGRALNQRLKPARQEEMADCGHLPMLEDPARSLQVVKQFLLASNAARVEQ